MKKVCSNCKKINEYERHYCNDCGFNLTICIEYSNILLIICKFFGLIALLFFLYLFGVFLIDIINRTGINGVIENSNSIILFLVFLLLAIIFKLKTNKISKKNKTKEMFNEKMSEDFLIKENKYKFLSKILLFITILSVIFVLVYNKSVIFNDIKDTVTSLHADSFIIVLFLLLFISTILKYSYIALIILTIVVLYLIINYTYRINVTIKYSKLEKNQKKILYFFINALLVLIFFIFIYHEIKNVIIPITQNTIGILI